MSGRDWCYVQARVDRWSWIGQRPGGRLFATSGLWLLSVTDGRTPVPGACTVVTVALVQAGTEELVFMGGGEYDEAQGERLLSGSCGPLVDADNEALIWG